MGFIAKLISFVFHPLFLATYLSITLMELFPLALAPLHTEVYSSFLVLIFLVTVVCPVVFILVLKTFGLISTISMIDRRERITPFTLIVLLHLSVTLIFHYQFDIYLSDPLMKFLITIDAIIMAGVLVTYFYRVSIHTLGIWGAAGMLIALNRFNETSTLFYATVVTVVIAGAVMSSRLYLKAHTPRELYVGSVLGFVVAYTSVMLLYYH